MLSFTSLLSSLPAEDALHPFPLLDRWSPLSDPKRTLEVLRRQSRSLAFLIVARISQRVICRNGTYGQDADDDEANGRSTAQVCLGLDLAQVLAGQIQSRLAGLALTKLNAMAEFNVIRRRPRHAGEGKRCTAASLGGSPVQPYAIGHSGKH